MVSPFTFYRGAAKIMAADLKDTPTAGLDDPAVRGCPPLELRWVRVARAGAAVRPERLRRDAPRPVRVRRQANGGELHDRRPEQRFQRRPTRRAASLASAIGLPRGHGRVRRDAHDGDLVRARRRPRTSSTRSTPPPATVEGRGQEEGQGRPRRPRSKTADKAHTRDSLQALSKLAEHVDGRYRIVSQPPVDRPVRDMAGELRLLGRRDRTHDPRPVPRLPGDAAGRPPPPVGALRG